jgi:hypothetical protein
MPFQRTSPNLRVFWTARNMIPSLRWEVLTTSPNPQAEVLPLIGCPRLFIQYIAATLYISGGRSSIHNLRTRHAVVTGTHLSWWQGPTYHGDREPLITVTGAHLSLWQGPTYHGDRDPLVPDTRCKVTLSMRACRGSGCVAPLILKLGTRGIEWSDSRLLHLTSWGRAIITNLIGGWVHHTTGLDSEK